MRKLKKITMAEKKLVARYRNVQQGIRAILQTPGWAEAMNEGLSAKDKKELKKLGEM